MHSIRIEIRFDSGHRLLDYPGKCAFPHGHTYCAEIFLQAPSLDSLGLVFDFTDLKDRVKRWIDDHWDHAFLVNSLDAELISGLTPAAQGRLYLLDSENPSCEVLSRELFHKVTELCGTAPAMVRLWESSDQYAEYREDR